MKGKNFAPNVQIGVLVQKYVCRQKPCVCGSHGPVFINFKAHQEFINNIFAAIKKDD